VYDSWGNPTLITDTLGLLQTFTYEGPNVVAAENEAGQRLQLRYGDQSGWRNMLSTITASGSMTTTLSYNAAGDFGIDPLSWTPTDAV